MFDNSEREGKMKKIKLGKKLSFKKDTIVKFAVQNNGQDSFEGYLTFFNDKSEPYHLMDDEIQNGVQLDSLYAHSMRALLSAISIATNPREYWISPLDLLSSSHDLDIESIVYLHISKWISKNATLEIKFDNKFDNKTMLLLTLKLKGTELFFERIPFRVFSEFLKFN